MGRTKHIKPRNRMSPAFVRADCSLFSCRFPTLLLPLSPLGVSATASVAANDLTTAAGRRLLCLLVSVEALLEGAREMGWIKAGPNASAGVAASRTARAAAVAAEVQPALMVAGCLRLTVLRVAVAEKISCQPRAIRKSQNRTRLTRLTHILAISAATFSRSVTLIVVLSTTRASVYNCIYILLLLLPQPCRRPPQRQLHRPGLSADRRRISHLAR